MKHGMRMKTGTRRKHGGIWRRWLAGLLAAVMLAELVPVYAREDAASGQAAELSDASADANASDASSTAEDAPYVLAEETALRGEAEKHFRLSDGTYLAVQYARPVHLQTADGQWADLNNELTLRQGAYQADNGLTTASFAQNLYAGDLFTATYRDYTVSMALAGRDWAAAPDAERPVTPDPAEPAASGEPEETPAAPVQGAATDAAADPAQGSNALSAPAATGENSASNETANPAQGSSASTAAAATGGNGASNTTADQGSSASTAAQENRLSGTGAAVPGSTTAESAASAQGSAASADADNTSNNKSNSTTISGALAGLEPAKPGRISDAVATLQDAPATHTATVSLEQQVQPAGSCNRRRRRLAPKAMPYYGKNQSDPRFLLAVAAIAIPV